MIYIVRHGETKANQTDTIRGAFFDDELTEVGHAQAKTIAEQLKDVEFDICYCSPLKRTIQTCEPIFSGEITLDKRLLPRDYGDLIGHDYTAKDLDRLGYWNRKLNLPVGNGESVQQIVERIRQFLDYLTSKHAGKNVLVVTHGSIAGVINATLDNFAKGDECSEYRVENCAVIKIPN